MGKYLIPVLVTGFTPYMFSVAFAKTHVDTFMTLALCFILLQGFNKELEDICRIQKSYAIPDSDLRQTLIKDNKDYITPKYKMFRDKYTAVNFTKNPDKYVKYTVDQVSRLLDTFFDATA